MRSLPYRTRSLLPICGLALAAWGCSDVGDSTPGGGGDSPDAGPGPVRCAEDIDCAGGELCRLGRCVRLGCESHSDCRGGELCRDLVCVPIEDGPGEDPPPDDGLMPLPEDPDVGAGYGNCDPLAEAPGCNGGQRLSVCLADGQWHDIACPCATGFHYCLDGNCAGTGLCPEGSICRQDRCETPNMPAPGERGCGADSDPVLGEWLGTFDGEIRFAAFGRFPVEGDTRFEVSCDGLKLAISGTMAGQGNGVPYEATLLGEYFPQERRMWADMNGTVDAGPAVVTFTGTMQGVLTPGNVVEAGTWEGESPVGATGSGTWRGQRIGP